MRNRYILGKNCILELLRSSPDSIRVVYTADKMEETPLGKQLRANGISVKATAEHLLTKMVDSESHQGYVALVNELTYVDCKEFIYKTEEKERSVVVMIDSIYDPQNLGAILRASECFGVDLVILCKNRGCGITPITSKTSAGGSELVPIANVSNLAETAKLFQEAGYGVITAEVREGAHSLYEFEVPPKTLLVLGSEGKGVQPLLSKKSDYKVYIPMLGKIDSLNVSQAAAVFLSTFCQRAYR